MEETSGDGQPVDNATSAAPIQPLPNLTPLELAEAAARRFETELKALQTKHAATSTELQTLQDKQKAIDANPLLVALFNMDAGAALEEAGEELRRVTKAVDKFETKGALTLTVHVKPFKGTCNALVLVPEIKAKVPKAEQPQSIFFPTDDGGLARNDPRQKEFKFKGNRPAGDHDGKE